MNNVVRRAGEILPTEAQAGTADHLIDAKLYIQKAYWDVCAVKPWRWDRKRKQFSSLPEIVLNVVNVVDNTVTTTQPITTDITGYKFALDSDGIPHRIENHVVGASSFALSANYTGNEVSGIGSAYQDEIVVASDILSFPTIIDLHWGEDLEVVSEEIILQEYPRNTRGSIRPALAAFISDSKIRIAPWTTESRLFECVYNYRPDPLTFDGSASDTPILPRDSRIAIAQRALQLIYTDKRDARFASADAEFKETLSIMSTKEITFAKPRLHVRRGSRVG